MTLTPIRVMLVDDHAMVRLGFRLLLEGVADIKVVAEADSGEEAVRAFPKIKPDMIVMDISMPGIGGLEAVDRILAREARTRILVLSAHDDATHARRVMNAGAVGYLTKRSAAKELIQAVRQVAHGKTYLEPHVAQQLVEQQLSGKKNPVDLLTEKEFKVFLGVAKGGSVAQIAKTMSLSPCTVGTHLYNLKQKLGASNCAKLAIMAIQAGLVRP